MGGHPEGRLQARLGRRGGAEDTIPSQATLEALKLIFISIEFSLIKKKKKSIEFSGM